MNILLYLTQAIIFTYHVKNYIHILIIQKFNIHLKNVLQYCIFSYKQIFLLNENLGYICPWCFIESLLAYGGWEVCFWVSKKLFRMHILKFYNRKIQTIGKIKLI